VSSRPPDPCTPTINPRVNAGKPWRGRPYGVPPTPGKDARPNECRPRAGLAINQITFNNLSSACECISECDLLIDLGG